MRNVTLARRPTSSIGVQFEKGQEHRGPRKPGFQRAQAGGNVSLTAAKIYCCAASNVSAGMKRTWWPARIGPAAAEDQTKLSADQEKLLGEKFRLDETDTVNNVAAVSALAHAPW